MMKLLSDIDNEFNDNESGSDLDIPGSELDDEQEDHREVKMKKITIIVWEEMIIMIWMRTKMNCRLIRHCSLNIHKVIFTLKVI